MAILKEVWCAMIPGKSFIIDGRGREWKVVGKDNQTPFPTFILELEPGNSGFYFYEHADAGCIKNEKPGIVDADEFAIDVDLNHPDARIELGIKPSDFPQNCEFGNTFGKWEKEKVAENIVAISLENNDTWLTFTFAEYKAKCGYKVEDDEERILDKMVKDGFLAKRDDRFSITNLFVVCLAKYIKS
jgi:hypothetical protein